jgi:release factor glutamine methyltransferase
MATIKQLITDGENALPDSDSARLDAELLLSVVIAKPRSWLYTWPDHIPALPEQHLYLELIRRRQAGEPVAYMTGRKEFWDLQLKINHDVLIPRPDTELLVETALAKLPEDESIRVADLGTGSGAIALALASGRDNWQLIATDQSARALDLAQENAKNLDIKNISFFQGSWLAPLSGQTFDAILSNPPYIEKNDPHLQRGDVRFEPVHALISEENGLADIHHIISNSPSFLTPSGWLMLEHGYQQGEQVRQLFAAFSYSEIETLRDLAGHERITIGRKKDAR